MNEEEFIDFMKKTKKPTRTIEGYAMSVKVYENYLLTHKQVKSPDEASSDDLKDFVMWGIEELDNVYRHLWGVRMYYEFIQSEGMEKTAREWMEFLQNENRKLREFPNVDRDSVKDLSAVGISTVNQILASGSTKADREALAARSGASPDAILELVKLSNLSRLPGLKKVRGRLFYEAGLDSLTKIAALEPEEVQRRLEDYIEETGFSGSAPTFSEAQVAVTMARFLPEIVAVNGG
jgi:hypothetical protein